MTFQISLDVYDNTKHFTRWLNVLHKNRLCSIPIFCNKLGDEFHVISEGSPSIHVGNYISNNILLENQVWLH